MQKLNLSLIKEIWKLARGYWQSVEKWQAIILLIGIISLKLGDIYADVLFNSWRSTFYNTLQNQDKAGFFSALGQWGVFLVVFVLIAVYVLYLQQLLEIKWRRWLTEDYLQDWLKQRTYYLMQVIDNNTDNPDQRISEDLRLFITSTLNLSLGLLSAIVRFCSFSVILWNLSGVWNLTLGQEQIAVPGYLVGVAIVYAIVGTWLTAKIGYRLVGLNFTQQRYEADFRFSMMRLRENSEGVAFYNGEQQEKVNFIKRFKSVLDNSRGLMIRQKKLSWFTSGFWQLSLFFPYIIVAPRFFDGQIQLGGLIQTVAAFTQVEGALTFFLTRYSTVAELQAVVSRLTSFRDNMERVRNVAGDKSIEVTYTSSTEFAVTGLDVCLPTGRSLLNNLELRINAGDTLLITGASGCGKSTLMKTLAGIWPFGKGNINIPQNQNTLFLPQKPYLPLGTLRDVLLYSCEAGLNTDKKIREVMFMCQLGQLVDQLDQEENWSQILSLGEQQRIAFARAILQQPQWLFLDEATSALDEPTERIMYRLLQEQLNDSAIISVGHRSTLVDYHKLKLSIGKAGSWNLAA